MDDHNVHNFWGASPFVDFGQLLADVRASQPAEACLEGLELQGDNDINILQVGANDCRHTVATMCRAHRRAETAGAQLNFYVFEHEPEVLARHILLISVLLDEEYPLRDRMEMFLEIHGNVLLSERTAAYLESRAHQVEKALMTLNEGTELTEGIGGMLNISLLKFEERDQVADALRGTSRKNEYNMAKAWDARIRKNLAERYDHRKNMIDWDYHMVLQKEKQDGVDLGKNSIIHFAHFREWRLSGVAYELRDIVYKEANRSLISTAYGRTKEFKDRQGADKGRSVSAKGYWGDVTSSPYHSFGTIGEEDRFFKIQNKQYVYTSVDVAHFNVEGFLREIRSSQKYVIPEDEEPPRAEASRGPTSHAMMEKAKAWTGGKDGDGGEGEGSSSTQEKEHEVESALDAAAWDKCKRIKIFLASGEFKKTLSGRKKFHGLFNGAFVGAHVAHLLKPEFCLRDTVKPGAPLVAETGQNLLFFKEQNVADFEAKVNEFTKSSGWVKSDKAMPSLPKEDRLFLSPAAPSE